MKHISLKSVRRISNLLLYGGLALCIAGAFQASRWPMYLGTLIALSGVLFQAACYRCPHCGRALNPRDSNAQFCPFCGESLNDTQKS